MAPRGSSDCRRSSRNTALEKWTETDEKLVSGKWKSFQILINHARGSDATIQKTLQIIEKGLRLIRRLVRGRPNADSRAMFDNTLALLKRHESDAILYIVAGQELPSTSRVIF